MRDKVKRFLSILMTALMLVNLMPVGALADGITSIGYKPEVAASTGNHTVYVYARFDGDPLPGVTLNARQWYTIGYIKDVNLPSPGGISWGKYWYYNNNNYCGSTINSTSASGIIGGLVQEYNKSIVIKSDEWISANFKACPGADTYMEGTSEPAWHLDIIVDINKNPPVHNLVFKVNNSNGKQIGTPKKVTGRWTNPLSSNKYYAGNPVPETIIDGGRIYQLKTKREGNPNLDTKIYFNEPIKNVEFYYKDMGPVKRNYTVNYYLNGTEEKVKTSTTGTKELGETVTPDTNVSGYTLVPDQKTSLTIVDGDNVLNLYYYKNVELTANSDTVPYNGQEQEVSGFTGAPEDADFSAITVGATGTNVGTYTAAFADGTVDTVDATGKYIVTKAINGTLKITPVTDKVVVTITGHNDTVTYNGSEQSVEGYDVSISAPEGVNYTAADFSFSGTAEAKGTNAGTYPMGLTADQFANTNGNFTNVTFNVTDGWLKINPVETEVTVTITGHTGSHTYDGNEKTVTGYDVSIDNELYTENDFTFTGTAEAKGTNVGTYPMGLTADQFANTNGNFTNVTFNVTDGWLKINPVETEVTVTITGHTGSHTYDGNEKTVTGYDVSIDNELYTENDFTFTGTAEAKGTDAGTYPMGLTADQFTNNKSKNFSKVTFEVADGWLKIDPVETEVFVKIAGNTKTETYNGKEHNVEGYTVTSISNPLYTANDFTFSGTAEAKGTDAGTYPMGLTADQFTNNKSKNFSKVTFEVADGWLKIDPVETEVFVKIAGNTKTETYNGKEHNVEGYTVTSISNDLYTEDDFEFTGEAKATGTEAGTYYMGLTAADFTNNDSTNFSKVTFVVEDGWLKINPIDEVTVTITENSGTATYDGGDHIVSGYASMTADNELYDVDASVQETPTAAWTVKGKDAGEYPVGIKADDFKNTNGNFTNVKFVVVDGKLTITPAPVTLQAPIQSKTYDGTPLEATQFGHSYLEGVNFADDFASVILTGSQTLVGSSASLITGVIPNEGKKLTNYNFTFVPGTLTVTDGTGDDPVVPAKVITKTHIPKDMGYNLGEPVTFTISVKNIYNTPKTITLTEKENVKFSNGESVIVFKDVPAGETVTAEATYTITSEDILAGGFTNTVTADFTGGGSWTAKDTVITAELDTTLNVTKTSNVPDGQKAALGQTITYTIKVQNAGNVPYTNVKVEDPLTGLTETIETLAVGETQTFTTEYVVTEADVLKGSVLNTATATGDEIKDPKSDEPKEPNGGDEVETPTFAPITIKPKDVTATYNGAAITGKDVEITSGKLLEGHKLSAAVIGSGVNAGSYALTLDPEKIKIVDANNKDVSEMYARTLLPGKLIINKRSVLITSQSATKTYDGSALTRPAVTITGDGFVPGELAKAEATGSITKVGSTPNTIQYTTTGAFNAANYSIALSVGTLTVTEKPKPEPRRTFNLTISYVYQNGKRAAASYNRGGLKNGETFDITSPVIAGYTASETVVSGTIYNRDIKVTVIYTADGVNLDDYGVPLGLGNITMNVGDCFE